MKKQAFKRQLHRDEVALHHAIKEMAYLDKMHEVGYSMSEGKEGSKHESL